MTIIYTIIAIACAGTFLMITSYTAEKKGNYRFTREISNLNTAFEKSFKESDKVLRQKEARAMIEQIKMLKKEFGSQEKKVLLLISFERKIAKSFDLNEELENVNQEIKEKVGGKRGTKTYRSSFDKYEKNSVFGEYLLALRACDLIKTKGYKEFNKFFMLNYMQSLHTFFLKGLSIINVDDSPYQSFRNSNLKKIDNKLLIKAIHSAEHNK